MGDCVVSDLRNGLLIETPGKYSMEAAIEILWYLEKEHGAETFDSGWKQGFGLNVAVDHKIELDNSTLSISTDDGRATILKVSGNKNEAFDVLKDIKEWVLENANTDT